MVDQSVSGSSDFIRIRAPHQLLLYIHVRSWKSAGGFQKSGNPFQQQTTSNNIKQPICVCVPENRAPVVHDHFPHSNMVSPIFKHIHPISRPKISTAHRTSSQSLPGQSGPCSKAHLIGQGPSASWAVLLACCNQYHNCRKWMDMVENGNLFKNTHITHIYDKVSGTRICCLIQSTKR